MDDWASAGWLRVKSVGNPEATAGRSNGGAALKPNASAPATILSPPRSRPIWANDVLQDLARIVKRVPPQSEPPKLGSGRVVPGSVERADGRVDRLGGRDPAGLDAGGAR